MCIRDRYRSLRIPIIDFTPQLDNTPAWQPDWSWPTYRSLRIPITDFTPRLDNLIELGLNTDHYVYRLWTSHHGLTTWLNLACIPSTTYIDYGLHTPAWQPDWTWPIYRSLCIPITMYTDYGLHTPAWQSDWTQRPGSEITQHGKLYSKYMKESEWEGGDIYCYDTKSSPSTSEEL